MAHNLHIIQEALTTQIQQHEQRYIIHRLTDALMVSMQIQEGRHLVGIVGTGLESDNRTAIFQWIKQSLSEPDWSAAEAALPHLLRRFEKHLHQRIDSTSY